MTNTKQKHVTELIPIHDSRKSFYGKAKVEDRGHLKLLHSYGTLVATVDTNYTTVLLHIDWGQSQTTLRHVKEFLKQHGLKADTRQQMLNDYAKDMY